MAPRIALVVCRHLLREADAVCRARHWSDVSVQTVAPRCERPWAAWPDLLAEADTTAAGADMIVAVGGACLPEGPPPPGRPIRVLHGQTCFALLTNESLTEEWARCGSYLVTPGWLKHWRASVAAWGYDRETARAHFAEFARVLRLLDTGSDEGTLQDLNEFAEFLGLEPVREPVGVDVLAARLADAVLDLRTSRQVEDALVQSAESTMLLDLSAQLMDISSEQELLSKIGELIRMLLPPNICRIASVRHGQVEHVVTNAGDVDVRWFSAHVQSSNALTMLPDDEGFVLQVRHRGDVVGVVEITRLAMPEHVGRYANAVMSMAGICGAAIIRSRALAGIVSICSGCKRIRGAAGWEPVDVYLRSHTDADFSHGLCPDCVQRLYPDVSLD